MKYPQLTSIFRALIATMFLIHGMTPASYAYGSTNKDVLIGDFFYKLDNLSKVAHVTGFMPGPFSSSVDVIIPASVKYDGITYNVTEIEEEAFYDCRTIESVSVPETVTKIARFAFRSCYGLKQLRLEDGEKDLWIDEVLSDYRIENIHIGRTVPGTSPFKHCNKLANVTIGNSVTSLGEEAFYGCTVLHEIIIPKSVSKIGDNAFDACLALTSVHIEDSSSELTLGRSTKFGEQNLFTDCPLESLHLGRNLSYKSSAVAPFKNIMTLTNLTIGDSVTRINDESFIGCTGITSLTIPEGMISIGASAFEKCTGLTSISLPNSMTSIGRYAFRSCKGLTSVRIGVNLNDMIGSFNNSSAIRSVKMAAAIPPTINKTMFADDVYNKATLKVRKGSKVRYEEHPVFCLFKSIEEYDLSDNFKMHFEYDDYVCAPNSSITLQVKVDDPDNDGYTYSEVNWSSSNPSVATINDNGEVTGISYGETTITASIANVHASTKVNIIPILEIADPYLLIAAGESNGFTYTVNPPSANNPVKIDIDDSMIAAVQPADGTIKGLRCGITKAHVYLDGYKKYPTEMIISVYDRNNIEPTTEFKFDDRDYYSYIGSTRQLTLCNAPYGAKWTSSNPDIARVDVSGNVTARSVGDTEITATALSPENTTTISANATYHVYAKPVESIAVTGSKVYAIGIPEELPATSVYPAESCPVVKWTSPDNSAEILTEGTFKASEGHSKIWLRAEAADGSGIFSDFYAETEIIQINIYGSYTAEIGKTYSYKCEIKPDKYGNIFSWSITGSARIIGEETGESVKVECNYSPGTFTLTATNTENPAIQESITVNVRRPKVTRIELSNKNLYMKAGDVAYLSASVSPAGANQELIWTVKPSDSSDKVIGVAKDGQVTAVQLGKGTLIAYDPETGVFGFCNIEVSSGNGSYIPTHLPEKVLIAQGDKTVVNAAEYIGQKLTAGWAIDNLKIATFDSYPYGSSVTINGISVGETTLNVAQTNSSSAPAKRKIIVVDPNKVYSISFADNHISGQMGDIFSPQPIIFPKSASGCTLEWSSSDESVATVTQSGTITIVNDGNCVIYAKATDGTDVTGTLYVSTTAGIENAGIDTAPAFPADIYSISGMLIRRQATEKELNSLQPGIYIVRSASGISKIVVP